MRKPIQSLLTCFLRRSFCRYGSPYLRYHFRKHESTNAIVNHQHVGAKLKNLSAVIIFLTAFVVADAQSYPVRYKDPSGDSINAVKNSLQNVFATKSEAALYMNLLPSFLQTKGFITASIDSVLYDSLSASVTLYLGEQYKWAKLNTTPEEEMILQSIRWPKNYFNSAVNFSDIKKLQQSILDYLDENGHPFGKVYLDSIVINKNEVNASLKVDEGPIYKIDSIRIYGDAKINNEFLQRYLELPNGSIYNKKKLQAIPRKLATISYVEEAHLPTVDYLGTGSVLNLYLQAKKSSQANVLIGFLPNSDQLSGGKKFLLTVDANILLRNALGSGETIGLIWQQLQQKSPRLNIVFDQPYAFHSPFGVNFTLDMYKRDSIFLNINMNLGTSYHVGDRKTASVFLQRMQTIVSGINTAQIIQTKQLPQEVDVSSLNLGIGYDYSNTDFRFNPRKGNEWTITGSAGTKKIRKNNQILDLEDPSDPSFNFDHLYDTLKLKAYQFRIVSSAAHYIPVGVQSTVKLGLSAGIYQSASFFRNELFQIGGFKLLRGFDEESQFVSQYAIATTEYRYRVGAASYFFAFADGGYGKHLLEVKKDHAYFGTGVGMSFQTKSSVINLAAAVGKRDDTQINLRQVKVHLGFASYF